jgi:hypothetical protein
MKKILIYDDEENLSKNYAEKLRKMFRKLKTVSEKFDIDSLSPAKFEKEMAELERRRKEFREQELLDNGSLTIDQASVFIVDYDLLKSRSFLTGENVAYLARCFSKCGLIIGLNQYGENTFDLTLKGHLDSFCDLNIGSEQLTNLGLWGGESEGFRPWYWPQLLKYLEAFPEKVKDVETNLEDPICDVLELKKVIRTLPRGASEFIGGDPTKVTFGQFVKKSGNGLRRKDRKATTQMIGRIAGSRISKWLERLVLPGQDILVDAPHLVSRFPSLLKGSSADKQAWNKTAGFVSFNDLGFDYKRIEGFRFKKDWWLSRQAWFWGKVSEHREIKEVAAPWDKKSSAFVFCEDSSQFHERDKCREFIAESESPYVQRFIVGFKGVDYRPRVRLVESRKRTTSRK